MFHGTATRQWYSHIYTAKVCQLHTPTIVPASLWYFHHSLTAQFFSESQSKPSLHVFLLSTHHAVSAERKALSKPVQANDRGHSGLEGARNMPCLWCSACSMEKKTSALWVVSLQTISLASFISSKSSLRSWGRPSHSPCHILPWTYVTEQNNGELGLGFISVILFNTSGLRNKTQPLVTWLKSGLQLPQATGSYIHTILLSIPPGSTSCNLRKLGQNKHQTSLLSHMPSHLDI